MDEDEKPDLSQVKTMLFDLDADSIAVTFVEHDGETVLQAKPGGGLSAFGEDITEAEVATSLRTHLEMRRAVGDDLDRDSVPEVHATAIQAESPAELIAGMALDISRVYDMVFLLVTQNADGECQVQANVETPTVLQMLEDAREHVSKDIN